MSELTLKACDFLMLLFSYHLHQTIRGYSKTYVTRAPSFAMPFDKTKLEVVLAYLHHDGAS